MGGRARWLRRVVENENHGSPLLRARRRKVHGRAALHNHGRSTRLPDRLPRTAREKTAPTRRRSSSIWPSQAWICGWRWAGATDQGTREHLAEQIQMLALNEVTYVPWGEWDYPTVLRKSVKDVVQFMSPVFWNVRIA